MDNDNDDREGGTHLHIHVRMPRLPRAGVNKWGVRLPRVFGFLIVACVLSVALMLMYTGVKERNEEQRRLEAQLNHQSQLYAATICGTEASGVDQEVQLTCLRDLRGSPPDPFEALEANKEHYENFLKECLESRLNSCEQEYQERISKLSENGATRPVNVESSVSEAIQRLMKAQAGGLLSDCQESQEDVCARGYRQRYGSLWYDDPKSWHYR